MGANDELRSQVECRRHHLDDPSVLEAPQHAFIVVSGRSLPHTNDEHVRAAGTDRVKSTNPREGSSPTRRMYAYLGKGARRDALGRGYSSGAIRKSRSPGSRSSPAGWPIGPKLERDLRGLSLDVAKETRSSARSSHSRRRQLKNGAQSLPGRIAVWSRYVPCTCNNTSLSGWTRSSASGVKTIRRPTVTRSSS